MTFLDLPAASSVFLDANTLVYALTNHAKYGPPCIALLDRIARNELAGFTSTHMLSEAAHRLMTLEAIALQSWPQAGIALRMRNHPAVVQCLTSFRPSIESIPTQGVQLLIVDPAHVLQALAISQQTGLLHNDALIVVVMQHYGLTNIASVDSDFDRVPGITRYAPV